MRSTSRLYSLLRWFVLLLAVLHNTGLAANPTSTFSHLSRTALLDAGRTWIQRQSRRLQASSTSCNEVLLQPDRDQVQSSPAATYLRVTVSSNSPAGLVVKLAGPPAAQGYAYLLLVQVDDSDVPDLFETPEAGADGSVVATLTINSAAQNSTRVVFIAAIVDFVALSPVAGCDWLAVYGVAQEPPVTSFTWQGPTTPFPAAATRQAVAATPSGVYAPVHLAHDPRSGWTCVRAILPASLNTQHSAVEVTAPPRPGAPAPRAKCTSQASFASSSICCFNAHASLVIPPGAVVSAIWLRVVISFGRQRLDTKASSFAGSRGYSLMKLSPPPTFPLTIPTQTVALSSGGSALLLLASNSQPCARFSAPTGAHLLSVRVEDPTNTLKFAQKQSPTPSTMQACWSLPTPLPATTPLSAVLRKCTTTTFANLPTYAALSASYQLLRLVATFNSTQLPAPTTSTLQILFGVPKCPAGTGGLACKMCPPNTYSTGGTTTAPRPPCAPCRPGTTSSSSSSSCKDTTPPVITLPTTFRVKRPPPPQKGGILFFTIQVTDLVDPSPKSSCKPPSGTHFKDGKTPVVCTATDASGNKANATFVVTVRKKATG